MKEQIKVLKKKIKIQVSNEDTVNLSDAQFKTLVIRMLTEMVEYVHKMEGKSESYAKLNKGKCTGSNSDRKETRTQINGLDQKEEINIQPEQNEETRTQKNEESLRNPQGNFRCCPVRM